jgi:hypothetical protein
LYYREQPNEPHANFYQFVPAVVKVSQAPRNGEHAQPCAKDNSIGKIDFLNQNG